MHPRSCSPYSPILPPPPASKFTAELALFRADARALNPSFRDLANTPGPADVPPSVSLDRSIDRSRTLRQRPAEQPARESRPLRRPEVSPLPPPPGLPLREIPTIFKAAFIRAEKRD